SKLCTITLTSGTGTCNLPATGLPAGTAHLTATYSGSTDYATSASATTALTVGKAATKTSLTLSRAKVTYGKERTERLQVVVTAQRGGAPAGTVVVKAQLGRGRASTVCIIMLASGKGKCTLAARRLRAGTYRLTAYYLGRTDFARSATAAKLTVVR
ncbi:MAG TPA: Ig-like domain-containing protein, partial [Streptosporangiaceae bacterium]